MQYRRNVENMNLCLYLKITKGGRFKYFLYYTYSFIIALEEDIDGEAGSGVKQTIKNIQAHLPQAPRSIQINDIRRVTKNFNCKSACDFRTYEYLIPTFAFHQVIYQKSLDRMG